MLHFPLHVTVLGLSFLTIQVQSAPREPQGFFHIDDSSQRIQYGYKGEWVTVINQPEMGFFNNTETSSDIQGALLRFTFLGVFTSYRLVGLERS
jgi:hypothetical protein